MKIFRTSQGVISAGVPFELAGVAYPWNWLDLASAEDLLERGITVEEIAEPAKASFLSQELLAQLSPADINAIQSTIAANPSMLLLWYSMLAQRDEMHVGNDRVKAGWTALVAVLGKPRMDEVAAALRITPPV